MLSVKKIKPKLFNQLMIWQGFYSNNGHLLYAQNYFNSAFRHVKSLSYVTPSLPIDFSKGCAHA